MTPPRSSNRPNNASASKVAGRQDTRNSEEHDGMDEIVASGDVCISDADHDDQEESQEETQSKSAEELLSTMVVGARKRHVAKKKKVIESYSTTAETIETSIDTLFDEHEEKSSAAHEAQLIRLKELLDQKANIEAAMEAKLEALRSSYDAHSRDLESVLSTRIMELN
ncbi:hypothetical protein HBI56_035900 [Parastagonospora nodorum]|uniref:Uncharacterized protein n=3 Tax=Phaeosphaeria nodorum (strain SN15 / ATCC MYA-4574 / FGSC 10173) TaxID=321614 RepID=A0A7U2EZ67_PHANO|nr:hypothetical protein SNOG_03907 [Parastagonospora nodorum SN15]KAH3916263.1 hypothetical protein HBH56_070900 [Parastagonospora nodorum]EAT89112.1 hypothetical protein SNOG_03907 [Parastagonospora nodorum SN15]KAH3932707.1 hypothetical protein HBH54_077210 [Parastagonospora nodorum]KAH3955140.1 hypothetical protein HBH53_017150 [Parastagonospora nodorum]KAH4004840.1 hypothetical protein HBI10_039280 [Parastagonospora nodorum]